MGVASFVDILVAVAVDIGDDDENDAGAVESNEDGVERSMVVSVVVVLVVDILVAVVGQYFDYNKCVATHYHREHYGNNCVAEVSAELAHIHGYSFAEFHEARTVAAEGSLALRCHY